MVTPCAAVPPSDAAGRSDRQVRVVISADVPLKELFTAARDLDVDDDKRALMDDLKLTNDSVGGAGTRI